MLCHRNRKLVNPVEETIASYGKPAGGKGELAERKSNLVEDSSLKSDLPAVLSEINETVRVNVQGNRRLVVAQSLDRVLSIILGEYSPETRVVVNEMCRRLTGVGASVVSPTVLETVRVIQLESRSQSKEDFELHLSHKLTWLITELSRESERADLAEEKCARLHECLSSREYARIDCLRKLRDAQTEIVTRTKHYRRHEHDKQSKINDLHAALKTLKDKYLMKSRSTSRFQVPAILPQRSSLSTGITSPTYEARRKKSSAAAITLSEENRITDMEAQELQKLRKMMKEIKDRESDRKKKEESVQKALDAIGKEEDRRKALDAQWHTVLKAQEDSSLDRATVEKAVKICSQKEIENQALSDELHDLRESLLDMKENFKEQILALEATIHTERTTHDAELGAARRKLNTTSIRNGKLEKKIVLEIENHKATQSKLTNIHSLITADQKTATELLTFFKHQRGNKISPEAKNWVTTIIKHTGAQPASPRETTPAPVAMAEACKDVIQRTRGTATGTQTEYFIDEDGPIRKISHAVLEAAMQDAKYEISRLKSMLTTNNDPTSANEYRDLYLAKCNEANTAKSMLDDLSTKYLNMTSEEGSNAAQTERKLNVVLQQKTLLDNRVRTVQKIADHSKVIQRKTKRLVESLLRQERDSEADFTCLSCLEHLKQPLVCHPCGHTLCTTCVPAVEQTQDGDADPTVLTPDRRCPECFTEILHTTSSAFIDSAILRTKAHRMTLENLKTSLEEM